MDESNLIKFQDCQDLEFKDRNYYTNGNIKKFGSGSHADIFSIGNKYVYKSLPKDIESSEFFSHGEISILIRLNHPNIVKIIDIINSSNFYDMIMLKADKNLWHMINNREFTKNNLNKYIYQLSSGIIYLHKEGIWHRDIKPDNILYYKDTDEMKICDFGISVSGINFKDPNQKYLLSYSEIYRPIEIYYGTVEKFSHADLWALGVIFIEMLIGRRLFTSVKENNYFGHPSYIEQVLKILGDPREHILKVKNEYDKYLNIHELGKLEIHCNKCPKVSMLKEFIRENSIIEYDTKIYNIIEGLFAYSKKQFKLNEFIDSINNLSLSFDEKIDTRIKLEDSLYKREKYPSYESYMDIYFNARKNNIIYIINMVNFFCLSNDTIFLSVYIHDLYILNKYGLNDIITNTDYNKYEYVVKAIFSIACEYSSLKISKVELFPGTDINKLNEYVNNIKIFMKFDFDISTCHNFLIYKNNDISRYPILKSILLVLIMMDELPFIYKPSELADLCINIYMSQKEKINLNLKQQLIFIYNRNINNPNFLHQDLLPGIEYIKKLIL